MEKGNITLYGYKLTLIVHNSKIISLCFDDIDCEKIMSFSDQKMWQQKIDQNDIELDFIGSDFDKLVWNALLKIPKGKTTTYKEISLQIGKPNSIRAVANAIGRNRIAILVPCHRVIRTDGTLGGFFWGIERKKELLLKEALM